MVQLYSTILMPPFMWLEWLWCYTIMKSVRSQQKLYLCVCGFFCVFFFKLTNNNFALSRNLRFYNYSVRQRALFSPMFFKIPFRKDVILILFCKWIKLINSEFVLGSEHITFEQLLFTKCKKKKVRNITFLYYTCILLFCN